MPDTVIYEVDCSVDEELAADFDAWLPGHVREVLACPVFWVQQSTPFRKPPGSRHGAARNTGW